MGEVPGYAMKDPSDLLLGTADGTFTERAKQAGILSYKLGRGAALVDLNLDGLLDLVQVPYRTPVLAWRNVGSGSAKAAKDMGHWVSLDLDQPGRERGRDRLLGRGPDRRPGPASGADRGRRARRRPAGSDPLRSR